MGRTNDIVQAKKSSRTRQMLANKGITKLSSGAANAKSKAALEELKTTGTTTYLGKTYTAPVVEAETHRLRNMLSGAGKSSASSWVNTAGTILDLFGLGSKNTSSMGKRAVNAQTAANHYREMLERGTLDNGKVIDAATRKQLEMLAVKADQEAKIYSEANEKIHAPNQQAVQNLQSTADKLSASAQADIAKAKQGLGKGGQFAVDVGVAGTQLLGDALTGGLVATGVRTFGSGAQEARQAGADLGKQIGYGAGSAAVGVATEKIANVAGPFKKAFGSGVLDKALGKVASKPAGKLVVSALSEGGEEFVDALTQPVLQQLTYNPDAAYDADWLAEALYSAAVGSVLGGAGGAIDVATAKHATQTKAEAQVEAKPATVDTQKENAVQSVSVAPVKPVVDPLVESITNGKRVEYSKMTTAQLDSMADRKDIGVDAKNRVFQINPEQHIDSRNTDNVSDRNLNAFQFDHPQLHQYYKKAAEALIADAEISQQFGMDQRYERTMQGNKVIRKAQTSQHLGRAMKETGLTRNQIIDAAQRIVNDHGQENVKAAKQIEIILDTMLTDGWSPMMGDDVAPNQDYINAKNEILGAGQAETESVGAAEHGFDPYSNLQNQSDKFHPEGPNAARPVDMPTQNLEGRNIPKSGSTIYGAQGTTESGVQILERDIANGKIAFDTITDADSVAKAQATMQELTFDGALERYRNAVNSGVATKDNTTLGQQLLLQAMRDGNETATAELLALYTRNSTNAAQAMQAQSIFRKLSPEGQLVAVQKTVDALNEKYGSDAKLDDADVKEFLEAKTEEERKEVEKRMVKKLAERIPKTFKAKYDTLRYLAMLGNPRTHVRNILGNAFFQVPVALKNRAGAVAERVSNLKGTQVEKTKTLFGTNPFSSIAKEARADFANAKDFLSQSSKYNDSKASLSNVEQEADAFSNENVLGRAVNAASNWNKTALEAEDDAFKKFIYAQSLADYLRANGVKSMKDADPALLNRARVYAAEEAQRNTFTDRNDFSDAVAKLGGLTKSDSKTIRAAGYVVEGALPFKRTPANIVARAAEYSPVGAVVSAVKAIQDNKSGDADALAKDLDRLAAGVSGTALLAAGFIAAGAGYVSGGEDEDKAQADFDKLTGKQAYALELNGRSYTLDWLAPEAIPFFMGVELYNASLENGLSWEEAVDAVKNMTEPMLEMSMLQGLNDLVENATNAKYSGNSVAGSIITSALTNYATQIFPTLGGQLERTSEEVRMSTYTDKNNPLPSNLQYTLGKVSQKIPGWDYQQIPYIDAWGREESTGDPMLRAFENAISPGYISEVDMDHLETELQKLVDQGASSNVVFPDRAEKSIEVDKVTHRLTAEQYVKYAKAKGQNSYNLVNEAVNSAYYKSLGKDGKQDYISKMYGYADYKAKKSLFPKYESDLYTKYEKAEEVGMKPADYYAMRETYDYDHSSSTGQPTQEEAQFYLDTETNLSRDQKEIMWNIINSSWKKNPYS